MFITQIFANISNFLGIKWAPLNVPVNRRLEVLGTSLWSGYQAFGETICIIIYITWLYSDYWWMAIMYAVWLLYDIETPRKGGRKLEWVRNWTIWKYYVKYFPMELIKTADLDPSKNYLMATFPHGILSNGISAAFHNNASPFKKLYPGMVSHTVAIGGHFSMPLFRELILFLGICACSKESLLHLLDRRNYQGKCVGLHVGGTSEAMITEEGKNKVYLKSRKGFVRVAIESGAPLVPVYVFGETDLYRILQPAEGSVLWSIQNYIRKIVGVIPMFLHGRGYFQYSFGIIPKRTPLYVVVGAPIEVKRNFEPSIEEVDAVHKQFVNALVDLFETHKHKYVKDYQNSQLEIF